MATGDVDDIHGRLDRLTPPWYRQETNEVQPEFPVNHRALLTAMGEALSFGYSALQYAKKQGRIATSTDGWLDIVGWDYFGFRFIRRKNEVDDNWRARIRPEILRKRVTREGIDQALFDLTGAHPIITELFNPGDVGGYGVGTMGYSVAGKYGSLVTPYQVFVIAYRPRGAGIPNLNGYGGYLGGYGMGRIKYVSLSEVTGDVTDADIYRTVADIIGAGIKAWVRIDPITDMSYVPSLDLTDRRNLQFVPGL